MSAFSVTEPFPTFHDRNGQPLEAGFLYIGVAGLDPTTNPITVYWDAALTIPAVQPIRTLNGYPSNGGTASSIYVDADDFSIAVHQSDNTLVFSSPNATVRIPLATTTGGISSDRVEYIEGSAGSTLRVLTSKLQDSVSVFDFMTPSEISGVRAGTFLIDVTASINTAVASGAREIFFPQGGYAISAPISMGTSTVGVSLVGAGRQSTVIRNTGVGTPAVESVGTVILSNTSIRIADMSIEGQAGTGAGVFLRYTAQAVLERLDCYANGVDGIAIDLCAHVAVNDCWSRSNTSSGLYVGPDAYFVTVQGGTFETNDNGVTVAKVAGAFSPRYVTFTGAAFRSNTTHNVSIGEARDVRFFGCSFETSSSYATTRHVSVNGGGAMASNVVIDSCSFFGNNATTTIVGLYANACEDVALTNSVVDCTGSDAYALTATAVRTRIVNCSVILGAKVDASAGTTQILPDGGVYALRRSSSYTGATAFDFASGYGRFDTTLLADAFRFYAVNAVAIFPVQRFDTRRVWMNPLDGYMYVKNASDPTFTNDGSIVNAGAPVPSYARGSLPAGVNGKIIRGTGYAAGSAWGTAEGFIAAGTSNYLMTWDQSVPPSGGWRVFAQA